MKNAGTWNSVCSYENGVVAVTEVFLLIPLRELFLPFAVQIISQITKFSFLLFFLKSFYGHRVYRAGSVFHL